MLETAMLKVWASDSLWRTVNDCIQIFGGKAYFSDEPYERMMRDARINQIGEGANDVMRQFIAMYGFGTVGKIVDNAMKAPLSNMGALFKLAGDRLASRFKNPSVPVKNKQLESFAKELSSRVKEFGAAVEGALVRHQKKILEKEYVQERLADAAIEIFNSASVLSRLDSELSNNSPDVYDDTASPCQAFSLQYEDRDWSYPGNCQWREDQHGLPPRTAEGRDCS